MHQVDLHYLTLVGVLDFRLWLMLPDISWYQDVMSKKRENVVNYYYSSLLLLIMLCRVMKWQDWGLRYLLTTDLLKPNQSSLKTIPSKAFDGQRFWSKPYIAYNLQYAKHPLLHDGAVETPKSTPTPTPTGHFIGNTLVIPGRFNKIALRSLLLFLSTSLCICFILLPSSWLHIVC